MCVRLVINSHQRCQVIDNLIYWCTSSLKLIKMQSLPWSIMKQLITMLFWNFSTLTDKHSIKMYYAKLSSQPHILLVGKKETTISNMLLHQFSKGSQYIQHVNLCNTRACLFPGTSLYRVRKLEWAFIRASLCHQFIMQITIAPSCAVRFQPFPFTLHCNTTINTPHTLYCWNI